MCGIDSHALVIECKSRDEESKQNGIKKWVDVMNGRRQNFEHILKQNPKYKKYTNAHLILVLSKEIIPTESEMNYARQQNVSIWDQRFISYYEQYPPGLRRFLPYHILADIGANISGGVTHSVIAFKSKIKILQKTYESYIFSASPSELLKHSYVARREQGGANFYQRIINPTKLNSVSSYINSGGSFVNNIVIAYDKDGSDDELTFTPVHKDLGKNINDELVNKLNNPDYNVEVGILQFPLSYKSFWIIDGQHRLFGYATVDEKIQDESSLPVVLIDDISIKDQMRLFVDINQKQKAINADLMWDIYGETEPDSDYGAISNLVKNIDLIGPLSGMFKIPSRRQGAQIGFSSFCRAIYKTGLVKSKIRWASKENPYYMKDDPKSTANSLMPVINDFFTVLQHDLSPKQFKSILNSTSIEVMVALFSLLVVALRVKGPSDKRRAAFFAQITPLKHALDSQFLKDIRKSTGESLKDDQTKKLLKIIAEKTQDVELKKICTEVMSTSSYGDLERGVREWLDIASRKYSDEKISFDDWFKRGCPSYFDKTQYEQLLKKHANQNTYMGHEVAILDMLNMGNIKVLLRDSYVKKLFNGCRKDIGTIPPESIESHLQFVLPLRNMESHGTSLVMSPSEERQAKSSMEILLKDVQSVKSYFSEQKESEFEVEDAE